MDFEDAKSKISIIQKTKMKSLKVQKDFLENTKIQTKTENLNKNCQNSISICKIVKIPTLERGFQCMAHYKEVAINTEF